MSFEASAFSEVKQSRWSLCDHTSVMVVMPRGCTHAVSLYEVQISLFDRAFDGIWAHGGHGPSLSETARRLFHWSTRQWPFQTGQLEPKG